MNIWVRRLLFGSWILFAYPTGVTIWRVLSVLAAMQLGYPYDPASFASFMAVYVAVGFVVWAGFMICSLPVKGES
jgi:hypothetical protein